VADGTGIEWTEATWNPVVGCTHVSAGCDNCYAAREASGRLAHLPLYAGLASGGKFTGEVRLVTERLDQPLRWRRPRRIFVNSMADLFHDGVPDEFIARVFAVMALAPQHTFQVLTKRHARLRSLLSKEDFWVWVLAAIAERTGNCTFGTLPDRLPNVWLGVSVEDQRWADIRIPALLGTPAAVRWISAEPLLGPVQLRPEWTDIELMAFGPGGAELFPRLDWVVAGGESGPRARPAHPDWFRQLRDQCAAAGVPYLFKQWGEWSPTRPANWRDYYPDRVRTWRPDGSDYNPREPDQLLDPAMVTQFRVGKKAAGRELDGRTWDQYPQRAGATA
jgi:protein gp37